VAALRNTFAALALAVWLSSGWTVLLFSYLVVWLLSHITTKVELTEYRESDSYLRRGLEMILTGIFGRGRKIVRRNMSTLVVVELALALSLLLAQPGFAAERHAVNRFAERTSVFGLLGSGHESSSSSAPTTTDPPSSTTTTTTTTTIPPAPGSPAWYESVCPEPSPSISVQGEPTWAKHEIYIQYLGNGAPGGGEQGGCAGPPRRVAGGGGVTWYAIGWWHGGIHSVAIAWPGGGAIFLTPASGPALRFLEDGHPIRGVDRVNVLNGDMQIITTSQGMNALVRPTKHVTGKAGATPYVLLNPSQLSLWRSYMRSTKEWVWPVRARDGHGEVIIALVTSNPYGIFVATIMPVGAGHYRLESNALSIQH
jgi:hypothetical protein